MLGRSMADLETRLRALYVKIVLMLLACEEDLWIVTDHLYARALDTPDRRLPPRCPEVARS